MIGFVGQVNGPGATEIRGFVATKHELLVLAKHWLETLLEDEYYQYFYGYRGSQEMRRIAFACRRISRIGKWVGEEEIDRLREEVKTKFVESVGPRLWNAFEHDEELQRDDQGVPIIPNE